MMNRCDVGSAALAYDLTGEGEITFVIDTALGTCSAEWRHIGPKLASYGRVLLYDRAGYGQSTKSSLERTPQNIAEERKKLIDHLGIEKNIVLIGHSQGGLYAVQFAILYPEKVRGMILLDPATPFDGEFRSVLSIKEFRQSGVDKTGPLKVAQYITAAGMGFMLKPLLRKGVPFCYHEFDPEAKEYLLRSLTAGNTYRTALAEYSFSHSDIDTKDIAGAVSEGALGDMAIKVLTHSAPVYTEELMRYGSLDRETAEKIDSIWQGIMCRYMQLSKRSEHVTAKNSGHYIHLTDEKLLLDTASSMAEDK